MFGHSAEVPYDCELEETPTHGGVLRLSLYSRLLAFASRRLSDDRLFLIDLYFVLTSSVVVSEQHLSERETIKSEREEKWM